MNAHTTSIIQNGTLLTLGSGILLRSTSCIHAVVPSPPFKGKRTETTVAVSGEGVQQGIAVILLDANIKIYGVDGYILAK